MRTAAWEATIHAVMDERGKESLKQVEVLEENRQQLVQSTKGAKAKKPISQSVKRSEVMPRHAGSMAWPHGVQGMVHDDRVRQNSNQLLLQPVKSAKCTASTHTLIICWQSTLST